MTTRRNFIASAGLLASTLATLPAANAQTATDTLPLGFEHHETLDGGVTRIAIRFMNRLNIQLAAHLYVPKGMNWSRKHRAVIIGHPFGAVKEQCPTVYATELAKRGIVCMAIDLSYGGESGGQPRLTVSPDAYVEDFSAAVDYLGTRQWVSRDGIGVLGICGSGGFAVCATSLDPRIKALVTVSMYDMGRATRQGLKDAMKPEQKKALLEEVAQERYKEFMGQEPRIRFGTPEKLPANASDIAKEFYGYYRTPRGYHPRYMGTRFTSIAALMNFYPFAQIADISPRPVLFVAGENAHSLYFSEDAYKAAAEPKELYKVKNAGHVDLYDRKDKIPFDKIETFFKEKLAV